MSSVDLTNNVAATSYSAGTLPATGTTAAPATLPIVSEYDRLYQATIDHADEVIGRSPESGMMGGYKFNPSGIRFASQNPYEKIYIMLRAHAIVNFGWMLRTVFWSVIPFVIVSLLEIVGFRLASVPIISQINPLLRNEVLIVMGLVYYSFIITSVLISILDWYFDLYIVTNERVLDYSFKPLVSYDIVEARLEDIESVKEKASGIFSSFFGYGDVFIKTAAETINIDFLSVPKPTHVRNIIADLSGFARRLFKKER